MQDTNAKPVNEEQVEKAEAAFRLRLIDFVEKTFREARKKSSHGGDWMRAAAELTVDHIFEELPAMEAQWDAIHPPEKAPAEEAK